MKRAPERAASLSLPPAPTRAPNAALAYMPLALLPQTAPAPEAVSTFAADCTTRKTDWNLGETVCVTVSGVDDGAPRRLVLANPDGFVIGDFVVSPTAASYSFTLPSQATTNYNGFVSDNRGSWIAATLDVDAAIRALAVVVVHDTTPVADLQINKTAVGTHQAVAGQNISFLISVFNQGPDAATNPVVVDTPPANTSLVSLTQTGGPTFNCTTTGGTTQCTRATLARYEQATFLAVYLVSGTIPNDTELTDTAAVSSDTSERRGTDNTASSSTNASNPTQPACTLACPSNVAVTAPAGQSGAVVTFPDTTVGSGCGSATTTPASGSFFAIGTSVVTTATADGQSCSFTVTVTPAEDNVNPVIDCPDDITVSESSPAANSAVVNYTVTASDNSGSVNVNCDPPSGSTFPAGTTQVNCTATDAAGNSASCSFNVTVNQSGCALDANSAAPTPVVSSLPSITRACSVTLLPADDPRATDACGSTITGTTPDRTFDAPGTYTVVWTYTDGAGKSTTQNQTVTILPDNSAPVPDAATLPTVTGECTASITGDPPTATDNCGGSGMVGVPLDPLSYNTPGTHTVRWQFTDSAGNSTIQNQTVIVTDSAAPVPDVASLPTLTGECSVTVTPPTATDNCAGAIIAVTPDPVTYTTQGTHIVHWTYKDAAGNTTTQNQTVIVKDVTPPTITAPPAKTIYTGPNAASCGVTIADLDGVLGTAAANDNCAGATVVRSGVPAGGVFPVGQTVLTYTVTDVGGNTASATQVVTVVDNTPPTLAVPDVTVYLPLNSPAVSMAVSYPAATTGDNCPGTVSVVYNPASGSTFPVGPTAVTATATDVHGNTTTKQFTVTVLYNFTGFFSPIANLPSLNEVKGGQSVPVKFSLSGNKGPGILAADYPKSIQISCDSGAPVNAVSELETLTAGNSGLTYDSLSDQYKYVWKTESVWAGTCRALNVKLNDGTSHTSHFKFK